MLLLSENSTNEGHHLAYIAFFLITGLRVGNARTGPVSYPIPYETVAIPSMTHARTVTQCLPYKLPTHEQHLRKPSEDMTMERNALCDDGALFTWYVFVVDLNCSFVAHCLCFFLDVCVKRYTRIYTKYCAVYFVLKSVLQFLFLMMKVILYLLLAYRNFTHRYCGAVLCFPNKYLDSKLVFFARSCSTMRFAQLSGENVVYSYLELTWS